LQTLGWIPRASYPQMTHTLSLTSLKRLRGAYRGLTDNLNEEIEDTLGIIIRTSPN
jgi:hypothetical protein